MIKYFIFLSTILFSHAVLSAPTLVDDLFVKTDCGAGKSNTDGCVYTPIGNCDGTQGTAVAIEMNITLPQDTGRFAPVAATSTLITFETQDGNDNPITWPTKYRQYQVGIPGAKVDVGEKAIDEWVLETLPANGDLYMGKTDGSIISAADHSFFDPDELWYKPDASFNGSDTFTYCAIDNTGRSNIATVNITVASPASYPMPVGITAPTFGINESPPADPGGWPGSEVANFYYIDSDNGSCSDVSDYGWPSTPRCNIPDSGTVISAGGKIVVADSVNTYPLRASLSWHQMTFNGTLGNEVWIIGNESDPIKPTFHHNDDDFKELRIDGSHWRISGITFDSVVVRHVSSSSSEFTNLGIKNSIVKNLNRSVGGAVVFEYNNFVFLNNTYYDNGIILSDLNEENDVQDMFNAADGDSYWYLDNLSYASAGDGYIISNSLTTRVTNVFLGRNIYHSHAENCADIKSFEDIIFSENDCYDLRKTIYTVSSAGNAQAFYINDENTQAGYAYFINNRCWDTSGTCFDSAGLAGSKTYFLGNVGLWAPAGTCLQATGAGEKHLSLNTCANFDIGLNLITNGAATDIYAVGNLLYNATTDFRFTASTSNITLADYNFTTSNPGTYLYGSNSSPNTASDLADFITQTGKCANCGENQSVSFNGVATYDFSITTPGSIIDAVPATIFGTGAGQDDALSDYATDIGGSFTDIYGVARPQNTNYDAGASEVSP